LKSLRIGLLAAIAGASLLLGGGVSQASGVSASNVNAGLTFGLTGTMPMLARVNALLQDTQTLQTRLRSLLQSQLVSSKYFWEQEAISEACVAGGRTCIGAKVSIVGDLTLAELIQEGFTNTNAGPAAETIGLCFRVHLTAPNTGTLTEAENETGPLLASQFAGSGSSGSVQLLNAAPTSTAALAIDASDASTGVSGLNVPANKMENASTLVTGFNVADNTKGHYRAGQLNMTLNGFVATAPYTNTTTGKATIGPGSVSCPVNVGSIGSDAINVLAPNGP
jgi:hypothetical protein